MDNHPYDPAKVVVRVMGQLGIVGCRGNIFHCFVCQSGKCCHVTSLQGNSCNSDFPALVELTSAMEDSSSRPGYQRKCLSTAKISFEGSPGYLNLVQANPRDYLLPYHDERGNRDGYVVMPHGACPSCGAHKFMEHANATLPLYSTSYIEKVRG